MFYLVPESGTGFWYVCRGHYTWTCCLPVMTLCRFQCGVVEVFALLIALGMHILSLPLPMAIASVGFSPLFAYLFFRTISQKLMQLGSPNVTYQCSKMSPGNPLFWSKVKVTSKPAWFFTLLWMLASSSVMYVCAGCSGKSSARFWLMEGITVSSWQPVGTGHIWSLCDTRLWMTLLRYKSLDWRSCIIVWHVGIFVWPWVTG